MFRSKRRIASAAALAVVFIALTALILWLDELGFVDIWVLLLTFFVIEILAFGLVTYLRENLPALAPSIVTLVDRVRRREVSPSDRSTLKGKC